MTAQPKVFGEAGPYGAELHVGDDVRAVRPLRQDGTFPDPGVAVGEVERLRLKPARAMR